MRIFTTITGFFCSILLILPFLLGAQEGPKREGRCEGATSPIYDRGHQGLFLIVNIHENQEKGGEKNSAKNFYNQNPPLMVWNTINPLFQPSFDVIVCS